MENKYEVISINPEVFEPRINEIECDFKTKHWYELGLKLLNLLADEISNDYRKLIYDSLISYFQFNLDPFHLAQILLLVAEESPSEEKAIEFLQSKIEDLRDAQDLLILQTIVLYTRLQQFETAFNLLNDVETRISEDTNLLIRSRFYFTQAELDKARGDYDSYYFHALKYLSASGTKNDFTLAYDLCMSALCSSSVCSFGELAAHPILESLQGEYQWLSDLIHLLDNGSVDSHEIFLQKFVPILNEIPSFASHLSTIQKKLNLSIFLQMIFERSFKNRVFKFNEIASHCKIDMLDVEPLVMKALASEIIRGQIDGVNETVVVTWCKPKALSTERLQHLQRQIEAWKNLVHQQRVVLEARSQPVVG